MNEKDCTAHSGILVKLNEICRRLDRADGISDDQWSCIHQKISTKTLLTITSIVTIIILAVVGFMWNGQRSIASEVKSFEEKMNVMVQQHKIDNQADNKELSLKIDGIKDEIRDLKVFFKKRNGKD